MNKIVVSEISIDEEAYLVLCLLDDKRTIHNFFLFNRNRESILNNIYTAKVENILPNINSAFLKIDDKTKVFMPLNKSDDYIYSSKLSKQDKLCIGDEIIVQVIKEAIKTKDAVVSPDLTVHGQHCIITTGNHKLGVSQKIKGPAGKKISEFLESEYTDHETEGYGIVVRTSAMEIGLELLKEDIDFSLNTLKTLISKGKSLTAFSKLYSNPPGYILRLKALDKTAELITDLPEIYQEVSKYNLYKDNITLYNDETVRLSTLYNLSGQIDKLLSNKVWLKSGANIIIEQIETLTFIDVNTGKNIKKSEDVFLQVNLEAAAEIAKQIRLRNISGMIVVDFINMKDQTNHELLIKELKKHLSKDFTACNFIDQTGLGLYEITRKKEYKSLKEIIKKY